MLVKVDENQQIIIPVSQLFTKSPLQLNTQAKTSAAVKDIVTWYLDEVDYECLPQP